MQIFFKFERMINNGKFKQKIPSKILMYPAKKFLLAVTSMFRSKMV